MKFPIRVGSVFIVLSLLTACVSAPVPPSVSPSAPEPSPSASAQENTVLTLATLEWPPYVGEQLPGKGFTTAIVTEAFKRAGYEVKISFMPWARVIQEVQAGKYDAAYPEYYSEERLQNFWLSEAFATGPLGFYKRKADPISYTTLKDLQPYRIGVVLGYVNTPEFDAAEYLQKEAVNSDEQNLRKLLLGRIDLAVIDQFVAEYLIKTLIPEGADTLEFMNPPLKEQPLHVIFARQVAGSEEKLQAFNAALKTMREDGTLDRILEEYGFNK